MCEHVRWSPAVTRPKKVEHPQGDVELSETPNTALVTDIGKDALPESKGRGGAGVTEEWQVLQWYSRCYSETAC